MANDSAKIQALVRTLNLVPYFRAHEGATLFEAARDLNLSPRELRDAVASLNCLGVGQFTEELIDINVDYHGSQILADQGLDTPLRLTPTEASAFLLTLEILEQVPGLVDAAAVNSAAEKLRGIMDSKATGIYDGLAGDATPASAWNAQIAQALRDNVLVEMDYWSTTRDEVTHRVVAPVRIFVNEDDAYLRAWQPGLEQFRTFRVDRIQALELTDEPAGRIPDDVGFNYDDPFDFGDDEEATLELAPGAAWLAEHYSMTPLRVLDSGAVRVSMPIGSREWFTRFCLGQADRLRVVSPQSAVDAIAEAAAGVRERYTR